jgi:hypothetical protein
MDRHDGVMEQPSFRAGRLLLGVLVGAAAQALPFGAGWVATRIVEPSPGGGFEDLGAVAVAVLSRIG